MARLLNTAAAIAIAMLIAPLPCPAAEIETSLERANELLLRGKHAEAQEHFAALASEHPLESAVGTARAMAASGKADEAVSSLVAAAEKSPDSAVPHAELAVLAFDRGDNDEAAARVSAALERDEHCLAARWIQAELKRTGGQLDEAQDAYKWFVDYYNGRNIENPEDLRWIGLGAAQYARWKRLTDQFGFLVNELYPDALKLDESYWPAHYETGLLFLEKFNQAEASRALKAALVINPQAAEVHAALGRLAVQNYDLDEAKASAERALEINPQLVDAYLVQADVHMANFDVDAALEILNKAVSLNPRNEATLGRLAAAYIVVDGLPEDPGGTRLGQLIDEVAARNPHAGEFYFTAATRLEERRQFAAADQFFREAIRVMPQLIGPRAGLGMMAMRLGEEDEARRLLEESFELDPFNVRVSNTIKVLEVLDGYETLETEHFILKFDPSEKLLARYAAEFLEQVYPEHCQWLGYEPEGKSLFEIFSKAKNTGAHGWFSARMVGLPYIGTVGACAGKMVAMASPNGMPQKFNWARVLKHEFVHVINLEQTNNNIPHWFTEALAVWNEGYPRPQDWTELLAARMQRDDLFDLDTINFGFIRPQSGDDWTLAYCQSELYAEYIVATYGEGAIARLLDAFAEGLATQDALPQALGVEQAELEKGYRSFLEGLVAGTTVADERPKLDLAQLERAVEADPDDVELVSQLAYELVRRKSYPLARRHAERVLQIEPKHQLATYVLARLQLVVGDNQRAVELLEAAVDPQNPQENAVALLAGLKLKAKEYAEAARWYELASQNEPDRVDWIKALARVHLEAGDDARLAVILERLAEIDADDVTFRKKLAQLALADNDYEKAVHWARRALEIDVLDAETHKMLADGHVGVRQLVPAIAEYEVAIELDPKNPGLRFSLADACVQAEQIDRARQVLKELLELAPDYPGADVLLESLEP